MNNNVTIAGKTYELRYRLSDRGEIEKRTKKSLWDSLWSGMVEDQVTVIWAGIKHKQKTLTPDALMDRLETHVEQGGSFQEVYLDAMTTCCKSKILGDINEEEVDRILAKMRERGEGKEEAKS